MRIEFILPVAVGVIMGLLGLGLLFDAWTPDDMIVARERRRRPRVERHRGGEALVGLGVLGMAAAFLGRDVWKYRTLAVLVGSILLVIGAWLNRRFLGELITNRGALRRGAPHLPDVSSPQVGSTDQPAAQPAAQSAAQSAAQPAARPGAQPH